MQKNVTKSLTCRRRNVAEPVASAHEHELFHTVRKLGMGRDEHGDVRHRTARNDGDFATGTPVPSLFDGVGDALQGRDGFAIVVACKACLYFRTPWRGESNDAREPVFAMDLGTVFRGASRQWSCCTRVHLDMCRRCKCVEASGRVNRSPVDGGVSVNLL